MNERELEQGLEEVRKAKKQHPEADRIEWINERVEVTYHIYPEGYDTDPF